MNLNQKTIKARVYTQEETSTASGAKKKTWKDSGSDIDIAIFYVDETSSREPFRFKQTTHVGLSYCYLSGRAERALLAGDVKYRILEVNPSGRLVRYLLEEVDLW